jgi:phosphatidylinositol dimannoside acyltransferase
LSADPALAIRGAIAPAIPRSAAADSFSVADWLLSRAPTRRFATARAAYEHAGLASGDSLARLVVAGARHRWRYSARVVTLCSARRRAVLQSNIEVDGIEHLDAAAARGRGVVMVSVHLSDFDLGGAWLAQVRGHEVVTVVGGPCARLREAVFDRIRHACGIRVRREETTRLADLLGDLGRGRIVTLMLDRRPRTGGIDVELLDQRAVLSAAPLLLARSSGAPVLVAGLKARADGGHTVRIAPVTSVGLHDGSAWLQRVALQLEELIRWAPEQWHIPPRLSQLAWVEELVATPTP